MIQVKCAHDEMVELHKLQENPKNPNKHPDAQIEYLAKLIDYQGVRHPIVVSKRSGFIVAGHGRYQAFKKLGYEKAPVNYQDFDNEAQEFSFMVSDNKIAELAEHDDAKMLEDLKGIEDLDLEMLGIPDFKIDELKEIKNTSAELDIESFDNFDHQCPKCGFEWNDDTTSA